MIIFHDVSKSFNNSYVLRNIDLQFEEGRTTVLIGSSGCGKSTILRLISGLLSPTKGRITFDGEELSESSLFKIRRQMGFVPQGGGLFPHLTAKDNIILMSKELKLDSAEIAKKLEEVLEICQFKREYLNYFPSELSGGQIQRAALMRGLMLDPKVLLLDEPLGALDPVTRRVLQEELKQTFCRLKKTVVFVTHDMAEAEFFGDRTVLMSKGVIMQTGSIEDIADNPKNTYVREFLNSQRSITW